jgi:hypothetical protein
MDFHRSSSLDRLIAEEVDREGEPCQCDPSPVPGVIFGEACHGGRGGIYVRRCPMCERFETDMEAVVEASWFFDKTIGSDLKGFFLTSQSRSDGLTS